MLVEMSVRDFALFDDLSLSLSAGLNVISGETGAGKSLLIDAMTVVTGGRAQTDFVRTDRDSAHISAMFSAAPGSPADLWLKGIGYADPGGSVVVQRDINRNGPSVARINGRLVTAGQLGQLCRLLLDMHGQNEHQSLVLPRQQRRLLDRYGGPEVLELVGSVGQLRARLLSLASELERLGGNRRDREQRLEWLTFQIQEIESAELRADEEEGLLSRRAILANLDRLRQLAGDAYDGLRTGDNQSASCLDQLALVTDWINAAAQIDPLLRGVKETVTGSCLQLEEAAVEIRGYLEDLAFDPKELALIEQRLDDIARLKRKYGDTVADILNHLELVSREKTELEGADEIAQRLNEQIEAAREQLGTAAEALSQQRKLVAADLQEAVNEELARLSMEGARFSIEFSFRDDSDGVPVGGRMLRCGDEGYDGVEFYIAPNPGEPPRPLGRSASGGELSRIMLAIKTVLAGADEVPTLIFDEIDAGIGGQTARRVAGRLAKLARHRQVLCVTHLAPIAAAADRQLVIEKSELDGRTTTALRQLEGDQRVDELARMLAASPGGAGHQHARELLAEAGGRPGEDDRHDG